MVLIKLVNWRSASLLFDRLLVRPEIYVTVRPTAELLVINVRVHKKGNIIKSARTKQACGLIGPHHHRISSIVIVIVALVVMVLEVVVDKVLVVIVMAVVLNVVVIL